MGAKLVIAKGKTSVKEIPLDGVKTTIGRRADCGVRIPSALVSRRHCELVQAGGRLMVKDLGSSNGTFVNGSKVREKELRSGDTLGVGPLTFIVQLDGAAVSPSDTARPPKLPVAEEAAVHDAADFVVEDASAAAEFILPEEEPTADAGDLALADTGDVADFVVEPETASADEIADFVVADAASADDAAQLLPADDAAAQAVAPAVDSAAEPADFVVDADDQGETPAFVAEEDQDASFVVADEITGDVDSVQDAMTDAPEDAASASGAAAEPAQAKTKRGLLGRFFGKDKKQPTPAPAVPCAAQPAKPQPAAARQRDAAAPLATEEPAAASESPDDMADFLMSLNEKDQ
jgi:hypothetical protein